MKRVIATALLSCMLALLASVGHAQVPDRDELMKPYPNPSWNNSNFMATETYEISEGLYTFYHRGTRSIFMVTDDGVIATDPASVERAKLYRDAIREVTDQPVKYVVYSHSHWDHILGGQIFKDEGAQFISHENCMAYFEDVPNEDVVLPDITFSGNYTLELGGRSLELLYFGPNHSDCMVVMRPDPGDYLFIVDLLNPRGTPMSYMPDFAPHHWVRTLKEIEAIDYEALIGGHGVTLAHPSAVTERRVYLETLMTLVKGELDKGASSLEVAELVKPKMVEQFSYLRNFDRNIDLNISRVVTFYVIGW